MLYMGTVSCFSLYGGSRGLVVKVLDSKFEGCEFKARFVFEA